MKFYLMILFRLTIEDRKFNCLWRILANNSPFVMVRPLLTNHVGLKYDPGALFLRG